MKQYEFQIAEKSVVKLKNFDSDFTGDYKNKEVATADLQKSRERIAALQEVLYAEKTRALLLIFQAMDASGKDSTIKHIFTGVNPQGISTVGFAAPTAEEADHDYLWRASKALPARGKIGIFSRSYYEETLVVRVHPEILQSQRLPEATKNNPQIWEQRFEEIRNFENYLTHNGVHVLKFFINISRDEQKKQLMERIEDSSKHWKFSFGDLKDRAEWDKFMDAYAAMFAATSTENAPWFVIPGNKRWFTRATIACIIADKLESLDLKYPEVSEKQLQEIAEAKRILKNEK